MSPAPSHELAAARGRRGRALGLIWPPLALAPLSLLPSSPGAFLAARSRRGGCQGVPSGIHRAPGRGGREEAHGLHVATTGPLSLALFSATLVGGTAAGAAAGARRRGLALCAGSETTDPPVQSVTRVKSADLTPGQKFRGVVTTVGDKGYALVDIGADKPLILHHSAISTSYVNASEIAKFLQVGQEITVWTRLARGRSNLDLTMVDQSEAFEQEAKDGASDSKPRFALKDIVVGRAYKGTVLTVNDTKGYATVDIGPEKSGFLPANRITGQYTHPSAIRDFVKENQEVTVYVKELKVGDTLDNSYMGLSMVPMEVDESGEIDESVPELGSKMGGTVSAVGKQECAVELPSGHTAILERHDINPNARTVILDAREWLKVGDRVQVCVESVDSAEGIIHVFAIDEVVPLAGRRAQEIAQKVYPGDWFMAVVEDVTGDGAKVRIELGAADSAMGDLASSEVGDSKVGEYVEVCVKSVDGGVIRVSRDGA